MDSLFNMCDSTKESILDILLYYKTFPNEIDYNIVKYGNLLTQYDQVLELYQKCGYESIEELSPYKLWDTYISDVGMVIDYIVSADATEILNLICLINDL